MTMSEEEAESQLSARRSRSMSSIQRTIQKKEKQIEKKNSNKKKGTVFKSKKLITER